MKFFQIAQQKPSYCTISLIPQAVHFNMTPMQKPMIYILMVLSSLLANAKGAVPAPDQLPDPLQNQTTQIQIIEPSELSSNFKNELQMNLMAESYFQSSGIAPSNEQAFQFQHKFNFTNQKNKIHTNVILGRYQNNKSVFGAVPEFYYQYSGHDQKITQQHSVGRKILDISRMDQHFNLGLTNSLYTQDFIVYQNQGLMGFHHEINSDNWGFHISFLPLYLPNQGPEVKEINGKIEGSNRWVKKPPTQFAFNNENKEIIYSVDYSDISNLILNPGALVQFRWGSLNQKIHWVTSFSKKPMNEPILERETFGDLDVVGKVNLVPNVIYNQLLTTELRYNAEHLTAVASYMADQPENKTARDFHSIQNLNSLSGYSFLVEYDVSWQKNKNLILGVSAADFFGGEIIDLNSDGSENLFTFTNQRLKFKKPTQFYFKTDLAQIGNQMLGLKTNWLYDREQVGSILSSELNIHLLNSLNIKMGFDVIGTEDQKTENYGFLQNFQANDRVYGGLDYVF